MVQRILLVVAGIISLSSCVIPPFITPCNLSDQECIKENTIKGIPFFGDGLPDYGVEILDPVFFKSVDCSSPNLKFIMSNIVMKGLRSCKAIDANLDAKTRRMTLKISCSLTLDGNYELDGQVLIVKIAGKGNLHVFMPTVINDLTFDYILKEGKDGNTHLRIKKFHHTYQLKGKSDVVFQGLFAENDVLSKAADELMKSNGNDVIQEIGGKMFEASLTKIVENFNNFFAKVTIDEIVRAV